MATVNTTNNSTLIRTDLWAQEVKAVLQEDLLKDPRMRWITGEFPDGDTLHIPTMSELNVRTRTENQEMVFDNINTGEFTLTIDKQYYSAFSVSDEQKEDSFYMSMVLPMFTQGMYRALSEQKEHDIAALQAKQTSADPNNINGFAHRAAGSGTDNAITLADIADQATALSKANIPKSNRFAYVDPVVSNQLVNIDNVIRQDIYGSNSNLKDMMSPTSALGTYLGFNFYEDNVLDTSSGSTDIDGTVSVTDPVYNIFCGYEAFIGAMRVNPQIEMSRDHVTVSDRYSVRIRYGIDLYRPEALGVIATKSTL